MSLWNDIATSDDGVSYDVIAVLAIGLIPCAVVMQAYALYAGKPFDCQGFGIGMGAVIASVGAAMRLRGTPGTTTTETATATTKTTEVKP